MLKSPRGIRGCKKEEEKKTNKNSIAEFPGSCVHANDLSDFKVYGPFRRNINPADLSPKARLLAYIGRRKTKSNNPPPCLDCTSRDIVLPLSWRSWNGYTRLSGRVTHGGGIISVRSSDLPRVAWLSDMEPIRVPRHLRLGSLPGRIIHAWTTLYCSGIRGATTRGRPPLTPSRAPFFLRDDRSDNTVDKDDRGLSSS